MSNVSNTMIPVTILTGFLGSGKTTLLNHLIQKHPEKKFAIIENEFGDINIDNDLVVGADESIFEMSNGCICCTLNDELVVVLRDLLHSGKEFNHLIIETTGMAEPGGVAETFVSDPGIQSVFKLDATICLVDAAHLLPVLEEREEAKKQITFADYLLLNKKSDTDDAVLEEVKTVLREMNPFAQIETVDYAASENNLLALDAYAPRETVDNVAQAAAHAHSHTHTHDHNHDHTKDVGSHSFTFSEPFDFMKFMHWSNVLLKVQGKNLYRVKGIMNFRGEKQKMIFQSVQTTPAFTRGDDWQPDETRETRLVFIGKGLKRSAFERALRNCLAK